MKVAKSLIVFFLISLILSACSGPNTDSAEKILSPENQSIAIKGTWEISEVLVDHTSNGEDQNQWLHKKVQFSNEYISIEESVIRGPQYQMKRVSGDQYLLFNSKALPGNFTFPHGEIEVITIIDGDKFFCEVLVINENAIVLRLQNTSFYLNKLSSRVDEYMHEENDGQDSTNTNISDSGDKPVSTGVLIGLRSVNNKDHKGSLGEPAGDYNYRTLWISSENKNINPVFEMENIFFPRRSGFWKLHVESATENHKKEQYVVANNILIGDRLEEIQLKTRAMNINPLSINSEDEEDLVQHIDFSRWGEKLGEIETKINYISNDYISIEKVGKGGYLVGNDSWEKSSLQLIPIDVLPSGPAVKIDDILDETGGIYMRSALESTADHLQIDNLDILYKDELMENFGIKRRLGHWFLKGRINYIGDKKFKVADYNINLMPPSEVVVYDSLYVPWTNIKDRVPRALDAYTSPNRDIAIVFTKDELLIYSIEGNKLGNQAIERLRLSEDEVAIMAEWATGHYIENWRDVFIQSGGQPVS